MPPTVGTSSASAARHPVGLAPVPSTLSRHGHRPGNQPRHASAPLAVAPSVRPLLAPRGPEDQPQEQLPTPYTTTVQGTVPDLAGRWLLVGYVGLQKNEGPAFPISLGWNITQPHGKLNVVSRYGGLPPGAKAAFDAAVSQEAPWELTEEQLHELRDGWDTVAPDRPPIASIETAIGGPDAPGDLVKTDPTMADALFTFAMVINYTPGQRVT